MAYMRLEADSEMDRELDNCVEGEGRRPTRVIMHHARYIFPNMAKPILPHHLQLIVLWQWPTLRHLYPDDMQAPVICRARKAMDPFDRTDALHPCVMLVVGVPRLARHITLKPCRIPNLHCLVVRSSDKEHMVRGNRDTVDCVRVREEVSNKNCLDLPPSAVSGRGESVSVCAPSANRSLMYRRAEVLLELLAVIKVQFLQKCADSGFLTIYIER